MTKVTAMPTNGSQNRPPSSDSAIRLVKAQGVSRFHGNNKDGTPSAGKQTVGPVDLIPGEDGAPSVTRLPVDATLVDVETYTSWASQYINFYQGTLDLRQLSERANNYHL